MHCHKSECSFRDILAEIKILASLSPINHANPLRPLSNVRNLANDDLIRGIKAKGAWSRSLPIGGTPAETYLRSRSITCELPDSLRYLPPELTYLGPTGHHEMIGKVEGSEGPSIQRTLLTADGTKAQCTPNKLMFGKVKGGAVRLSEGPDGLVVAEGIETALSLCCGLLEGDYSVWSALSAAGMRALKLPAISGHLIIAADGDKTGIKAARDLSSRAKALGWRVRIAQPPQEKDFNDIINKKDSYNV